MNLARAEVEKNTKNAAVQMLTNSCCQGLLSESDHPQI
jgi:hypothetical protein